jgi:hypothetical protein
MQALRKAARATAVASFDLKRVLLPQWNALFENLINRRLPLGAQARARLAKRGSLRAADLSSGL